MRGSARHGPPSCSAACRLDGLGACEPDRRQAEACDARSELDLRVGAAFTRFQTFRLQQLYPSLFNRDTPGGGGVVSYGGCQTPTLGFVVDRFKEHHAFISEDFWKLSLRCGAPARRGGRRAIDLGCRYEEEDGPGRAEFSWDRSRVFDEGICNVIATLCHEAGEAEITSVQGRKREKRRPVGLTTTAFQQLASRQFRIAPADSLAVAEKLYQQGLLSYPRTETDKFPESMDLVSLSAPLSPLTCPLPIGAAPGSIGWGASGTPSVGRICRGFAAAHRARAAAAERPKVG